MILPKINSVVYFGKRRGYVVGYTTVKRYSHADQLQTYAVIELDRDSAGYMQPVQGFIDKNQPDNDCYVSMMLVHPSNLTS